MAMEIYSLCRFYGTGKCNAIDESENLVQIGNLNEDLTQWLFNRFKKVDNFKMTEQELIKNRCSDLIDTDLLCPYHRNFFGKRFSSSSVCQHPLHGDSQPNKKRKITREVRTASL